MISIIIPNYNKGRFIGSTIESVIGQTSSDWELIIVDDGSTDNSLVICERYTENPKIKVIRRDRLPKGANTCRNIGLINASGDFVLFLDSDDLIAPHCIERRFKYIQQFPDANFCIFPIGNFTQTIGDSKYIWKTSTGNNHLKNFLSHDLPWQTSSPLWRKEYLLQNKGFNESYARLQDVELHSRILLQSTVKYRISSLKEPDCYYRISNDRHSNDASKVMKDFISGVTLYLGDMHKMIYNRNKLEQRPLLQALKGTIITAIKQLEYQQRASKITAQQKAKLFENLAACKAFNSLVKVKDQIFIKYYRIGLKLRLDRFRGYNYLAKLLFMRI